MYFFLGGDDTRLEGEKSSCRRLGEIDSLRLRKGSGWLRAVGLWWRDIDSPRLGWGERSTLGRRKSRIKLWYSGLLCNCLGISRCSSEFSTVADRNIISMQDHLLLLNPGARAYISVPGLPRICHHESAPSLLRTPLLITSVLESESEMVANILC